MVTCVAYGCTNRSGKSGATFHSFPKDNALRRLWIKALRRKDWEPTKSSKICSDHFREADIDRTSLLCVRIRDGAVPCIFSFPARMQNDSATDDGSNSASNLMMEVEEIPAPVNGTTDSASMNNKQGQIIDVEMGSHGSTCCNFECEERENLFRPSTSALSFYGLKYSKGRHYRICDKCSMKAQEHFAGLGKAMMNNQSILSADFPKPSETVFLEDSDEEEGEDSDKDCVLSDGDAEYIVENVCPVLESTFSKFDWHFQLEQGTEYLMDVMDKQEKEAKKFTDEIDEAQRIIDRFRREFYAACSAPIKELTPVEIIDALPGDYASGMQSPSSNYPGHSKMSPTSSAFGMRSPRKNIALGVATKKVTPLHRMPIKSSKYETSQEVVALDEVRVDHKPLPPVGMVHKPRPAPGEIVFVMKYGFHGAWTQARVVEHVQKYEDSTLQSAYKIRYEYRKSSYLKVVPGKHLAYSTPSKVRLPVGTRVIALFQDEGPKENYYAGVIAEPPKSMNKYRYLVFFDDGYAQYIPHEKILVVCESSRYVWEDMHPESRSFIRNYLEQYPERPMVKLQVEQIVKTEWNGKWWVARVQELDCSLVKMRFDADSRTEWIYRGSARLSPLFVELSHARRIHGGTDTLRRHRGLGTASLKKRNMPYVEYTRTEVDDNKTEDVGRDDDSKSSLPPRAVARKSTSRQSENYTDESSRVKTHETEPEFGRIEYLQLDTNYRPKYFRPHQCSPSCISWVPYDPEALKGQNPLAIPLLCGWYREIVKGRGRRSIAYRSPCGRRIRTMEELHRYLRSVRSKMGVDLFDFDFWVHCCAEFVLEKGFSEIKDLSYGLENVPVSCVNCVDHSVPDFVNYSTKRLPMEGVPLNLDPEFLTGCDCEDDCRDRSKCACWQLTIGGTACVRGAQPDFSVGYMNKRLPEPVTTGIYECNVRCKCSSTCLNRVAQFPLQLKLQVFKTVRRGWGIRCLNDIPQGSFICVYAGRLLTEQGANEGGKNYGDEYLAELDYIEVVERMKEDYESDVPEDGDVDMAEPFSPKKTTDAEKGNSKQKSSEPATSRAVEDECITLSDDDETDGVRLPSSFTPGVNVSDAEKKSKYKSVRELFGKEEYCYIMDAKNAGNIGRYLNHSCSPNVFVQNVFVDTHDLRFPWVAFFALTYIPAGTELTWDYNYDVGSVPGKVLHCHCGAEDCRGRLL
ncbi:histone-lysine N-methyltransferase eggless-like isoform X2 [Schistocerca gregaria]|uniref:histone-lysine N-methyltransferase eggless-like isoform X2 n=1 Tax=Schistocerca gregaria TaxID=7010 RepID=UPI00211DAC64|nr:histone-lysine N-methyltransferase eggless-like isoform X2 [Schistocerca gregaria]